MKPQAQPPINRRNFLAVTTGFGAATAAYALAGPVETGAYEVIPPQDGGYRETPHVKRAYELARF